MSERQKTMDPEVALWFLGIKVGLPIAVIVSLYLLARKGDNLALAILIVVGTVTLIGLGVFVTLAIMDRMRQQEQLRFTQNLHENMQLIGQMQKIQNTQAQGLLMQNQKLAQLLPDPNATRVDALDAVQWDVYEETRIERG